MMKSGKAVTVLASILALGAFSPAISTAGAVVVNGTTTCEGTDWWSLQTVGGWGGVPGTVYGNYTGGSYGWTCTSGGQTDAGAYIGYEAGGWTTTGTAPYVPGPTGPCATSTYPWEHVLNGTMKLSVFGDQLTIVYQLIDAAGSATLTGTARSYKHPALNDISVTGVGEPVSRDTCPNTYFGGPLTLTFQGYS